MLSLNFRLSITNFFILISSILTFLSFLYPSILVYGINNIFLYRGEYLYVLIQFFIWTFLHWWILHLLFNSIFLLFFWNQLEYKLWEKKYFLFFLFTIIFTWLALLFLSSWNTIWISTFTLAILSYYSLDLYFKSDNEYKAWFLAIFINIAIWFSSDISLIWHLFWAISWLIFYLLNTKLWKLQK